MRILHTSDWHLGRTLEGRSRLPEQEKFVDELCELANDESIDLVLVAGDVFDTVNPPAAAEQLFYDTMARLVDGGRRGVVVIAGNHDNPERLRAAGPLAHRYGITLLGVPADGPIFPGSISGNCVKAVAGGPSWVEVGIPGCDHSAVVLALPYPSEARLKEVLVQELDEEIMQKAYSARVARIFTNLAAHYRQDTVNLAMSHLFMLGGEASESERPINLGGALTVEPSALPPGAQYVALGHLHRPQKVGGAGVQARYSGSPLAYSFSERGRSKSVAVIDVQPGQAAQVKDILICSGNPLEQWVAQEGLAQVLQWIDQGKDPNAWIELELHLTQPLTSQDIHIIRTQRPGIINIRPVFPGVNQELMAEKRSELSIEELFKRFYDKQTNGAQLDDGLMKLFLDLVNEEPEEVAQ